MAQAWWRLGHISDPAGYVPPELCSWEHRFDDPHREYRTLYCALDPYTCLREVLADLRPNTAARAAFVEFQRAQGVAPQDLVEPSAEVNGEWRRNHALVRGIIEADRNYFANLADAELLNRLEGRHAALLAAHGMPHLDIHAITSDTRIVTQTISRDLYDRGVAGLFFRSALDAVMCVALIEDRAWLRPLTRPRPMSQDAPELLQVCSDYGLVLRRGARSR